MDNFRTYRYASQTKNKMHKKESSPYCCDGVVHMNDDNDAIFMENIVKKELKFMARDNLSKVMRKCIKYKIIFPLLRGLNQFHS